MCVHVQREREREREREMLCIRNCWLNKHKRATPTNYCEAPADGRGADALAHPAPRARQLERGGMDNNIILIILMISITITSTTTRIIMMSVVMISILVLIVTIVVFVIQNKSNHK